MKQKQIVIAALVFSAALAQSQAQPGQPSAGAGATGQSSIAGSTTGVQSRQQVGASGQVNSSQQPNFGGQAGANQSAGINQPQPGTSFGGTNQQPGFAGTNQIPFGRNNQVVFGTNDGTVGATNSATASDGTSPIAGQNSTINEAAGATPGQPGQQFPPGVADQAFTQQLRGALSQSGATQIYFPQTRSTITVQNQNGTVTLRGSVSNEGERQSIESRIKNTPGITSVDNQLQVGAQQRGVLPRTPGINPAPNSATERRLLNP